MGSDDISAEQPRAKLKPNAKEASATHKLLKKDSRMRPWSKKAAKCPKVQAPSASTKAATKTRATGNTGEQLLSILERRLDNVVHRLGFAVNRNSARQMVSHGHILVNGIKCDIPSMIVKPGDVIKVKTRDSSLKMARETLAALQNESENHPDLADRASSETDRAIELRAREALYMPAVAWAYPAQPAGQRQTVPAAPIIPAEAARNYRYGLTGDSPPWRVRSSDTLRLTVGWVSGILRTPGRSPSSKADDGRMALPTPAATRLIAVAWCWTS